MTSPGPATVHASTVLVGARALLIRGPSGSGKSRLVLDILKSGHWPFTRLIGDDRIRLEAKNGRLLARPAAGLEGLLEVRGLGLRQFAHEPCGVIGLVVDLAATDAVRLPEEAALRVEIAGVRVPRIPVSGSQSALPLIWSAIESAATIS